MSDDGREDKEPDELSMTRRTFVGALLTGVPAMALSSQAHAEAQAHAPTEGMPANASSAGSSVVRCTMTINGQPHRLDLDPRTTLLDLLRERLALTGTKKGCDHGQCGACTVLVQGRRINSCLSLAVTHEGDEITTIEGLGGPSNLHPMQTAFLESDGFQCGYCTPGQICSAVAVIAEARAGEPSAVTADLAHAGPVPLSDDEVRERMSGNICRCGAYPNIVAAVQQVEAGPGSTVTATAARRHR